MSSNTKSASNSPASPTYRLLRRVEYVALLLPALVLLSFGALIPLATMLRSINLRIGDSILPADVLVRVELTTLRIAISVALVVTAAATVIALIMRRSSPKIQKAILCVCLFPLGVNIAFRVFGTQFVLAEIGVIFSKLHKIVPIISFSPDQILFTQAATVVGLIHWLFPIAMLIVFSGLGNIRRDLTDSASLLGVPGYAVLYRVVLPALRSQLLLCFILSFCLAYGAYITPAALGGIGDITVARLIGNLLDEGHSQSAILPAFVGIATPLVVSTFVVLASKILIAKRYAH